MPAAHRYWRMVGFSSWGQAQLSMSEIALYDASSARVDGAATLTSSIAPAAGSLTALQDANTSTGATWPASAIYQPGFQLAWDFGAAQNVSAFAFGTGPTLPVSIEGVTLQWSDSGVIWTTVHTASGISYPGATTMTATVSDPFWAATLLQIRFDDPAVPLMDDAENRAITLNGSMSLSAATTSGRQGYLVSPGGGQNGLQVPISSPSDPLNLSTGPFTIEWRTYMTAVATEQAYGMLDFGGGYLYSWPSIRLQGYGTMGVQIYLRSTGYGGDGGDITQQIVNTPIPYMQWAHWAITRNSSDLFTLWLNGASIYTVSSSLAIKLSNGLSGCNLGSTGYDATVGKPTYGLAAYYDDFRVTAACRYTAPFTPPVRMRAMGGPAEGAAPLRSSPLALQQHDGVPMPAAMQVVPHRLTADHDVYFGGAGVVYGTTEVDGLPDFPKVCRVRLQRERDGYTVAERWSKPDGTWRFERLRMDEVYCVQAFDHTHDYRATIADNLIPEPMA